MHHLSYFKQVNCLGSSGAEASTSTGTGMQQATLGTLMQKHNDGTSEQLAGKQANISPGESEAAPV